MEATAFLFDLDLTLLDSSAVAAWRDRKMWSHVYDNLHLVKAYDRFKVPPHAVPALLREAGHPVAVVTSSPRPYAMTLLKKFEVAHDLLVAYEDTEQHKPDPAPLQKALEGLGAAPSDAIHVGDAATDSEASYHAGVFSVGAAWGVDNFSTLCSAAPDALVQNPATLCQLGPLERRRYFAEAIAAGAEPKPHPGSFLPCGEVPRSYALGRYFKTEDPRHAQSPLAARILEYKNSDEPAPIFAQALRLFLERLDWTPNYIVAVPPKPSQSRNRFAAVLEHVAKSLPAKTVVLLDGLRCVKEIPDYKSKGPIERRAAVQGAFESKYTWNRNKVLLLDDVLTTGETLAECVRVLSGSGAAEVRVVAFGKDQQAFARKHCPACGRAMRVRNGPYGRFWGCSGYSSGECNHTESYSES